MSFPPKIQLVLLLAIVMEGLVINFAGMPLYYFKFPLPMGNFELVDLVESYRPLTQLKSQNGASQLTQKVRDAIRDGIG